MERIEQSWSEPDVLQLTFNMSDSELDRQLQQEACKGICHDMMLMGRCDSGVGRQFQGQKPWPLVVIEREKQQQPVVQQSAKRPSWRSRYKQNRNVALETPVHPDVVDVVYIHEGDDSYVPSIEVCPSPSDKISGLLSLQRSTP